MCTFRKKNKTMGKGDNPLLCMKIFVARSFLIPGRVPIRNFSAFWDKRFSTDNRDTPFSFIKFFDIGSFMKHRTVPLQNVLVLWDKEKSMENSDITLRVNFFDTRNILKHWRVALRIVSFRRKIVIPPSYAADFSIPKNIFMKQRMVPLPKFSVLWDNLFSTEKFDGLCFK